MSTDTVKCENCTFFEVTAEVHVVGACYLKPPVPLWHHEAECVDHVRPSVGRLDKCAEWQSVGKANHDT